MDTLFNGKYNIIKLLGSGGMSRVYLAENVQIGNLWAIKIIPKSLGERHIILAELNILRRLNHASLPRVVDIGEDANYFYIVEDYIEGIPLDKQLEAQECFDEAIVIQWAKQLCEVLYYLHTREPNPIIYRDMKPSNIIVGSDGKAKLIDFGISRELKAGSGSDTTCMGTRGYAAPEQYGTAQTDERTDIYSLGVTMHHLLTGKSPQKPPYETKPLRSIDLRFSKEIDYIVQKCVQSDPENRYQSVPQLFYDLTNIHLFNTDYKREKFRRKIKYVIKTVLLLGSFYLFYSGILQIRIERLEKYDTYIRSGYSMLNNNTYDSAYELFSRAISDRPGYQEAYFGIAQVYLKQREYAKSIEFLEDALNKIPRLSEDEQYNYIVGNAYYELADYKNSVFYLEKAVGINPNKTEYLRDLSVCYIKLRNFSEAREIINSIADSGSPDIDYVNGYLYISEEKTEEAIECFTKLIKNTNDENLKKIAYIEISSIYRKDKSPESLSKQIGILEEAESQLLYKDDVIILEMLAEAYFSTQEYDKSAKKFQRLLDLGYNRAYVYRNIAIIYQQKGDLDSAENILMAMKDVYPDDYRCYLQLAYVYLDMESQKQLADRNYQLVFENYDLMTLYAQNEAAAGDIKPLTNIINDLKEKGW